MILLTPFDCLNSFSYSSVLIKVLILEARLNTGADADIEPAKRKVLLVEDDFILFEELQDFLSTKGFDVLEKKPDTAVDNFDDAVILLHKYQPELAILDIEIKGKKDGIELGAYIKGNAGIPIIFLSGHTSLDNLSRIRAITEANFVVKADEHIEKQLWTTIQLLPLLDGGRRLDSVEGSFMKVYEFTGLTSIIEDEEPLSLEVFIKWNEITTIDSHNSGQTFSKNNNVILNLSNGRKYRARKTLTEIEELVPAYLVRCNQSMIINANLIDARSNSIENSVCLMGSQKIPVGASYRKKVFDQINLAIGNRK